MNHLQLPAPHNEHSISDSIQELASQLGMTQQETELVISIVQQNDPSLESLKHPNIQVIIKQRKGRWVQEEEEFANFLSQEFCLGLSEIDNGVTKRAYLSNKLSCLKMRISKKFKGQNNGKEVFAHKAKMPDGSEFTPQELQFYRQLHVDLEKKFIKSVLKSVMKGGAKKNAKKKTAALLSPYSPPTSQHSAHGMQLSNALFAGGSMTDGTVCNQNKPVPSQNLSGSGQHNLEFQVGLVPSLSMGPNTFSTPSAQINAPVFMGQNIPPAAHQDISLVGQCGQSAALSNPSVFCANQQNAMSAPPTIANMIQNHSDHNGMHIYPMNTIINQGRSEALLSHQIPAFVNHGQNNIGPNDAIDNQQQYYAVTGSVEGTRKRQISEQASSVGYNFPPLLQNAGEAKRFKPILGATASQAVSTSASDPSSNDESENSLSSNEVSSSSNGIFSDSNMPDLLSGFDKHAASMKTTTVTAVMTDIPKNRSIPVDSHFFAGAGGIGESPYITSKSFDELHQFWHSSQYLGKGLSPDNIPHLDLNQGIGNNCQQVDCSTGQSLGAGAYVSQQVGLPPSGCTFAPYVARVPVSALHPPKMNAPHSSFDQQSSLSDSSDLTTSD